MTSVSCVTLSPPPEQKKTGRDSPTMPRRLSRGSTPSGSLVEECCRPLAPSNTPQATPLGTERPTLLNLPVQGAWQSNRSPGRRTPTRPPKGIHTAASCRSPRQTRQRRSSPKAFLPVAIWWPSQSSQPGISTDQRGRDSAISGAQRASSGVAITGRNADPRTQKPSSSQSVVATSPDGKCHNPAQRRTSRTANIRTDKGGDQAAKRPSRCVPRARHGVRLVRAGPRDAGAEARSGLFVGAGHLRGARLPRRRLATRRAPGAVAVARGRRAPRCQPKDGSAVAGACRSTCLRPQPVRTGRRHRM